MRITYKFVWLIAFTAVSVNSFGQADTSGIKGLLEMSLTDLMNQKVVTASKFTQSTAEAASSICTITAEDIKNYGFRTLGDALNSQRGMYLSNDKNYLYVGSRGFSRPTDYNNRIVIMIDGHMMNEIVYGSASMGNDLGINPDYVDRIEIIRGPGSSVYGSGSMLNIVNLIMKKGADINGALLSAGIGSFGEKKISALIGKKINNTDISLSGLAGRSDGENYYFSELDAPTTNFGKSEGKDWEKYIGIQGAMIKKNFKLSASFANRSKGIPTGAFNSDLTGDVETNDGRFYLESSYHKDLRDNSSLLFRLYFDNYIYSGSYPYGSEDSFDASTGRWSGTEIQYYLKVGSRNIITAGIEYKYAFRADYREWNNDTTYFDKNFPYSFFSFYGQDQIRLVKNLNLTAGFRYDHYSIFGQALSPRLALVYNYSDASSLKLLYGGAFRIPNVYESFYESSNSQKRNPDIKPERIHTAELAWSHKLTPDLYGTLSLYSYLTFNLIDQVLDESDGLTVFRNIGRASGQGAEYEMIYRSPEGKRNAFINAAVQRTRDENNDVTLSNSPEVLIKSGAIFPLTKYFSLVPEFYFETGRKTLAGNETGNVYLFNIGINSVKLLKHFEASLKVRNIFNSKYYYPGGYEHVQDALVQDSRNICLKVTAHF
jgi:outer membrane receptor for ferrienterochelin and colicins